jgi:predicted KAP-like P-loop ATPase
VRLTEPVVFTQVRDLFWVFQVFDQFHLIVPKSHRQSMLLLNGRKVGRAIWITDHTQSVIGALKSESDRLPSSF